MYGKGALLAGVTVLGTAVLLPSPWIAGLLSNLNEITGIDLRPDFRCQTAPYTIRTLSYDPLIIHLENFITPAERRHLLEISASTLERSKVAAKNGSEVFSTYRTSYSTYVDRQDPVSQCIHRRVSEFQGFVSVDDVEALQVTAYKEGQEFRTHVDWFGSNANVTKDRVTTFFGTLEADCENCGTQFPDLPFNWSGLSEEWCRFVDCQSEALTVLPLPGSALFWRNLYINGTGDRRTRHSGQRLSRGTKTGVNIWTLQDLEQTGENLND